MEPQTPDDRLRWLEAALAGLARRVAALSRRLRAVVARPPALTGDERRVARRIRRRLARCRRDGDLLRAQLASLRGRGTAA